MEVALVQLATDAMPGRPHSRRLNEIPFDSQRKRLSTGACDRRARCSIAKVRRRSCSRGALGRRWMAAVELSANLAVTFRTAAEAYGRERLRVLAFAGRELPEDFELANAEAEMALAGLIGLEDPPPRSRRALQKCRDAGIKVIMVTGDHPHTATALPARSDWCAPPCPS